MDALADPSAISGLDESDPRSVAKFIKKMGSEMGEDMGGDSDQTIE
jgi:hypothetical protein